MVVGRLFGGFTAERDQLQLVFCGLALSDFEVCVPDSPEGLPGSVSKYFWES